MISLKPLWYRLRSTYFLPCRLNEYKEFLSACVSHGYEMRSLISFWRLISSKTSILNGRYIILRHDIDSDVSTAKKMWIIEQELGVQSSFYFCLCTLDFNLMRSIEQSGSEAGYHYEELATFAKQHGIRRPEELSFFMPEIQHNFARNIGMLRQQSGVPIASVASHGDFANRYLRVANQVLLESNKLRGSLGIEVEAYDASLMAPVTSRCSDAQYPAWWKPYNPLEAVRRLDPVIYVSTHPGLWERNRIELFRQDVLRLIEGIKYRLSK